MPRSRRIAALVAAVAVLAVLVTALGLQLADDGPSDPVAGSSSTTRPPSTTRLAGSSGAAGVGDPYFPDLGNGGYDVQHYSLDLSWDADGGSLEGRTTITATATQALASFHLDLAGLEVRSVEVDGAPALTTRERHELVVTPAEPVPDGQAFAVVVAYGGKPVPLQQGTDLFRVGWQTDGREAFVASEPAGAATFFPVNDHPSDKATYDFRITAPSDLVVATNGVAGRRSAHADGTTTWESAAREPMASYLVQIAIGDYEIVDGGTSAAGVPIRHVLHRDQAAQAKVSVARTAEMMDVLSEVWGPYPFETYGVLAVDEDLGFALETQTLTLIGSDIARDGRAADVILVHELAHQWVGDAVSPATWKDIWLNEGFATYSEWLWRERTGGPSAAQVARAQGGASLDLPAGDPGPDELFQDTVYTRGGLVLQALREAIGDAAFFEVLRAWVAEHSGGVASTADLVELSERVSGQQLDELFQRWVYDPELPDLD